MHSRPGVGLTHMFVAFLVMILLIAPLREFPVEDDWDYSKTVWNLLQTGTFQRLEVTQATVLFPTLWGALFSQIFGYSFATLRISTLVLAFGALTFFYLLLGELEFDVPRRVLAALALMVTPAFVYLAFSFMTDVPFLFGLLGALYFYVRAWRRGDARLALIGSAFAALAFLARQIGALIPLAFGLFVMWMRYTPGPDATSQSKTRWAAPRWILAGMALPLMVVGAFFIWLQFFDGANWADQTRTLSGTLGFWLQLDTAGVVGRRYVIAAATIGIYILPLWLAMAPAIPEAWHSWWASGCWRKWAGVIFAAVFVIAVARMAARDQWFPYLTDILTRRGLRPYLAYTAYELGAHRPFALSTEAAAALTLATGLAGWVLSTLMIARVRTRLSPGLACVYLTTAIMAAGSLTFFTYFERYLLPLMPGAIVLALDAARRTRISIRAGVAGVLIAAVLTIALMRDYFAWNEARWTAGRALLEMGVPVEQIDGGYEWNGWHLYDASVEYIRAHNLEMTIDPWKYVMDPQFMFAFVPPPNYRIVEELDFPTPLRPSGTDRFFLLQRER